MLFFVFYYLLAALLVFQGTQALGERRQPMGVVPQELTSAPNPALFWGTLLTAIGGISILLGLVGQFIGVFDAFLRVVMGIGLLAMAAYGVRLIFGRKIAYQASPSLDSGHH